MASKTPEERAEMAAKRDLEKVRQADRARYRRNREERQASSRAWAQAHPERIREIRRKWVADHPEERRAHLAVRRALRDGTLVRSACEFDGPECRGRMEAHHEDYSKPLDVRWLCQYHHGLTRRVD